LQGGMEGIATARTDAQGRYSFDRPEIGAAPMLVRVVYKNANYHQNVPPGRTTADIEIFEPTAEEKDLQVSSRMIIVQPNGPVLLVGEEYSIHNHAKPPATYVREFEFRIPDGAELNQVAAWGPAGMPVVQGTTNKGKNHYGIPFPLRPGENGIRISYQMAYATNQAVVGAPSQYPAQSLMVIAPPTMQISGADLRPAGNEQGYNVFARQTVPAGGAVDVAVSGTAPPPSEGAASEQASQADSGARVQTLPGRLQDLRWVLVGGFAALFALGAVFLWRKPRQRHVAVGVAGAPSQPAVSQAVERIAGEARQNLDQLKDALFRLEIRRQAGMITEQEYGAERARIEGTLRDLVKD